MFQRLFGGGKPKPVVPRVDDGVTPQTTLAQCLANSKTRDACLARILKSGGFDMMRPLGSPTDDSAQWDLPKAPEPFAGVAGVILDKGRTRVIAVVLKDGTVQKLSQPLFLPPELRTEDRPPFAVKDGDILRALSSDDDDDNAAPSSSNANVSPPPPPSYRPIVPPRPKSAAGGPPGGPPMAPPPPSTFVYSKPLMDGRMPVVTPATKADAAALAAKVDKAPIMPAANQTDFFKSVRDARVEFDAKNQAKKTQALADDADAKKVKALVSSGDKMIPVATTNPVNNKIAADVKRVLAQRRQNIAEDDDEW